MCNSRYVLWYMILQWESAFFSILLQWCKKNSIKWTYRRHVWNVNGIDVALSFGLHCLVFSLLVQFLHAWICTGIMCWTNGYLRWVMSDWNKVDNKDAEENKLLYVGKILYWPIISFYLQCNEIYLNFFATNIFRFIGSSFYQNSYGQPYQYLPAEHPCVSFKSPCTFLPMRWLCFIPKEQISPSFLWTLVAFSFSCTIYATLSYQK